MLPDIEDIPLTEEQKRKIYIVRIAVGDVPASIFYPIVLDAEIYYILEEENWNVNRAVIRIAVGIAFQLSMLTTREKTADIEVWNAAATEYRKVLEALLKSPKSLNLPDTIIPYVAGASKADFRSYIDNPDFNRSPLFQITPCAAWWTRVDGYERLLQEIV